MRYLSYLENAGSNLTLEKIEQLAVGLGVEPWELLQKQVDPLAQVSEPSKAAVQGLRYAIKVLQGALQLIEKQDEQGD